VDSGFLSDFFLTYRLFMSPVQLCKYLIQRYLWALELDTESRCVVRVRTFVVFRYWINSHFADDFLTSKSLRFQMASFLNSMRSHPRVQASPRDSRIIRSLMDFFKHQRRYYKNLAEQSVMAEQRSQSEKSNSHQELQGANDSADQNGSATTTPIYKPFILFYRSQMIAQQLCLIEQHFLEQIQWDELLEMESIKAGRKNRSKNQPSIGGYQFKPVGEWNGMNASNDRSNMLCMWVASEVVSTHPIEDRVRVIEKFIRIAQKCYQYRNFNSLIQLVMGLGCSHLSGLRRTWSRVGSYEMRVLEDLQYFISPCGNWRVLRRAMNQVRHHETEGGRGNHQGTDNPLGSNAVPAPDSTGSGAHSSSDAGRSKGLQYQVPLEKEGCIPFVGLFVYDLTHITVSPPWYLPLKSPSEDASELPNTGSVPTTTGTGHTSLTSRLEAPDPSELQGLLPTGTLLVNFYRFQLIGKSCSAKKDTCKELKVNDSN
ncbi:MAG: ras guanine nucleotide exchange factor domain-containing protein, partial [Benniella sp.]